MQTRGFARLFMNWINAGFVLMALLVFSPGHAAALSAQNPPLEPIGSKTQFLQEADKRLTLDAAIAAFRAGLFRPAHSDILSFGIGAAPVWIRVEVDNSTPASVRRHLTIATSWLDEIEIAFLGAGEVPLIYQAGDINAYKSRSHDSPGFVFAHDFAPGSTEIFLRIATPDPMVIPLWLSDPVQPHAQAESTGWSYGLVYGYLLALLSKRPTATPTHCRPVMRPPSIPVVATVHQSGYMARLVVSPACPSARQTARCR